MPSRARRRRHPHTTYWATWDNGMSLGFTKLYFNHQPGLQKRTRPHEPAALIGKGDPKLPSSLDYRQMCKCRHESQLRPSRNHRSTSQDEPAPTTGETLHSYYTDN